MIQLTRKYEVYVNGILATRHLTAEGAIRDLKRRFEGKNGKVVRVNPVETIYVQGGN
jgi:hypothetical protein